MPATSPALDRLTAVLEHGDRSADADNPVRELRRRVHALEAAASAVLTEVTTGTLVALPPPVEFEGNPELRLLVQGRYFTAGGTYAEQAQAIIADNLGRSYLRNEVDRAIGDTDRGLREVIGGAVLQLRDLHLTGQLPYHRGFTSTDQALRELPRTSARLQALADATVHAAHVARHAAGELAP